MAGMSARVRAFQAAAASDTGGLGYESAALVALSSRARAAHVGIEVPDSSFARCLAHAAARHGGHLRLEELPIEDLYLACACAARAAGAAAAFEARFGKVIRRAVARVLSQSSDREEATQRTRQVLLVGDEAAPPKIATYEGHGPLESWVSVVAIRVAVSLGRSESVERRLREKAISEAAGPNPEVLYMKGEVRRALELAIEGALGALQDRERTVLRLYLVSGMTLAAIGRTFGVTQQSVSRWLQSARDSVLADVRRALQERLHIASDDLTSFVRLVASQLDISISQVLAVS
jgi:RNA polymerase sigma-70 factor, ECF subfamily